MAFLERRLSWNGSLANQSAFILDLQNCGGGCVNGVCRNNLCNCNDGYEGDRCEDKESWWNFIKEFASVEGIIITAASMLLVLVISSVILWRVRVIHYRAFGRFSKIIQLVAEGHIRARDLKNDEAAALYHNAFQLLCGAAFAGEKSADAAATECDKALRDYNSVVGLGVALGFGIFTECQAIVESVPPIIVANFEQGLGADIEPESHRIVAIAERSVAAEVGLAIGDQLIALDGEKIEDMGPEAIRERLEGSGNASFERGETGDVPKVVICSRCACGNHVNLPASFFRCFSCQACVLIWDFITKPCETSEVAPARLRVKRIFPQEGYPQYQGLTWEQCSLRESIKHPLGFGEACAVPADCQHHKQVGATCGVCAVNNLITNCKGSAVDAEHMMAISKNLGQAEAAIRDGVQCVEEAGEEQQVSELYASTTGGHFDVQTLQIAFDEAGFNMWYMPPQKLQKPSTLFQPSKKLAGYVVHRKDPLNGRRDHWFILRLHRSKKHVLYLLQDSLYDKVFELTRIEAHHLLLSMPTGALFAVSRQ